MANGETREIDHGHDRIRREIDNARGMEVVVGFMEGARYEDSLGRKGASHGTRVAQVAAIHEYGAPAANIPERSFMRATMTEKSRRYRALLRTQFSHVLTGRQTSRQALDYFGAVVAGDMRRKITEVRTPPLKPATIRAKSTSAGTKDNPLIETGLMRASLTHEVRVTAGDQQRSVFR